MTRVLFVCLGNICRSPLAEGILRRMVRERGLDVEVDSAGTGDWHVGDLPDHRARQVGAQRGCEMTMRARQFRAADFEDFDLIVVMDHQNHRNVLNWRGTKPEKVYLATTFDAATQKDTVPDPYYGGMEDFEEVADMLEAICAGILDQMATVPG